MAASFLLRRATSRVLKGVLKPCKTLLTYSSRRYLLSSAYSCTEAWKNRLEDPVFSQVPLSEFAIQLRDHYEKEKKISAVDMEILANKLHEMDVEEADFMEDLMMKFRRSPDASPVRDSVVYVTVRSYLEKSLAPRLLPLLQQRSTTGLFPDPTATSLLLDHFITQGDFHSAALVAYEVMLQEDLSHPTSRLLALYAAVRHFEGADLEDLAPEEIRDPPAGEDEDWIPVKYIRYPTYDDHFDIRSQQYLLGKTLWSLGRTVEGSGLLSNSLQIAGLALYHKFEACLRLLASIAEQSDSGALVRHCLTVAESCLEKAQERDPEKPEKEFGLMTIEDEIYKLLPTGEEKEGFRARLQELKQRLENQGRVTEDKLSSLVEDVVMAELPQHEAKDIETQTLNLAQWREERQTLLQEQLYELEKRHKVQEIEDTLKDLQEKEEMIRFFELYDQVKMAQPKKLPEEKEKEEDLDEEVLRARRIKRRKYRHNI